ncbi:MAG: carboxymuconolactone decarboxylase family protein [Acidobacteria bacterium]|nr:carboxymuconolactone decarboxylase family protein [Acidobacteriota bacterium]
MEVTPRERALLDYAILLTSDPAAVGPGHIESLRAAGLTDEGVHAAAAVTAYFNFVNRIALGLGVELEEAYEQR